MSNVKEDAGKPTTRDVKEPVKWGFKRETLFTLLIVAITAYAAVNSTTFPYSSGLYPMVIAIMGLGLAIAQVIVELRQKQLVRETMDVAVEESQKGSRAMRRAARFLGWVLGIYAGIWLIGYQLTILSFLVLFMRFEGHIKWLKIMTFTSALAILVLWVMPDILDMVTPAGLLQDHVAIPFIATK